VRFVACTDSQRVPIRNVYRFVPHCESYSPCSCFVIFLTDEMCITHCTRSHRLTFTIANACGAPLGTLQNTARARHGCRNTTTGRWTQGTSLPFRLTPSSTSTSSTTARRLAWYNHNSPFWLFFLAVFFPFPFLFTILSGFSHKVTALAPCSLYSHVCDCGLIRITPPPPPYSHTHARTLTYVFPALTTSENV
jgi:hypothetical protein